METTKPDLISVAVFGLSALTFLLTYLRASINKSNRDIDRNTISTLKDNNDALSTDLERWKKLANDLQGQNKVLQSTVTSAPEIAKLAAKTAEQHKESMQLQKTIIKELQEFVKIAGKKS